jgi:putative transposase
MKRQMIDSIHTVLPISVQCRLLALSRSSYYYQLQPESELNLYLMDLIDQQYTKHPFYGARQMTKYLRRQGYRVNHKRVERLMRKMGIMAIYPKPHTSVKDEDHKVYPYLLRDLPIAYPDQVWCADITYVRMRHGFLYLIAIMDWFSRYVLSWVLSNTLDVHFCLEALEQALAIAIPEIFNTDQGCQFTSNPFTGLLTRHNIRISMDGRGRAFDNIFIERLWRTVKYEQIYLHDYQDGIEAYFALDKYFRFYNEERTHSSLDYKTPAEVYYGQESQEQVVLKNPVLVNI